MATLLENIRYHRQSIRESLTATLERINDYRAYCLQQAATVVLCSGNPESTLFSTAKSKT